MKSIIYNVYHNGRAGLSNLIMSIELGVVLAHLTDRLLILKGNRWPPANVVKYDGAVRNRYVSRVTDLIDLGVPWIDADSVNLDSVIPHDLCNGPVWERVFYYPAHLSPKSEDIKKFAGRRRLCITLQDKLQNVPALAFSGGPKADTLSFYSYFFYLDEACQFQAYDALRKMRPKPELESFANSIAKQLGSFNAVHVRRGDFKVTKGVTTLDRSPREAIAALDDHFPRDKRLIILTDEADDPFFDEIKAAYPDHIFLDRHILQEYGADFHDLPTHDSVALAYLSQLIGAESDDFIGTMTSTFTSLIQRRRANRGKQELFKFLWNELPAAGDILEPGRHKFSDCIQLDKNVMVPEFDGPYSWNKFDSRLNPAWMREWPESVLDETAMTDRARGREITLRQDLSEAHSVETQRSSNFTVSFLDSNVAVGSDSADMMGRIRELFKEMISPSGSLPLGTVRISDSGQGPELVVNSEKIARDRVGSALLRRLYREVVCQFINSYQELIWLHAGCASSDHGAIVFPGTWGRGKSSLVMALCKRNWTFLSDDIAPLDAITQSIVPFPATPRVRRNDGKTVPRSELGTVPKTSITLDRIVTAKTPRPLSMIVFPHYSAGASAKLTPMSPGEAVGELLQNCLSLAKNEDTTINQLCRAVEALPAFRLQFDNPADAVDLLIEAYASVQRSADTSIQRDAKEEKMASTNDSALVDVEVTLKGGLRYPAVLPADSPILHDLYVSLASSHAATSGTQAILIQLPIDEGRASCSFMSSNVVAVTTRPPVLIRSEPAQNTSPQVALTQVARQFVLVDDFLTPAENERLMEYALANEKEYQQSSVTTGKKDYRKSKVYFGMKQSEWYDIFMSRLKLHLPHTTATLGMSDIQIGETEMQLTASNDGEYFRPHADAGNKGSPTAGRELTYVYYLHRSPKSYVGGDLFFYDGRPGQASYDAGSGVTAVTSKNNRLVLFASNRWHEVDMVRCPTKEFADGRFTVNGWLRRAPS